METGVDCCQSVKSLYYSVYCTLFHSDIQQGYMFHLEQSTRVIIIKIFTNLQRKI